MEKITVKGKLEAKKDIQLANEYNKRNFEHKMAKGRLIYFGINSFFPDADCIKPSLHICNIIYYLRNLRNLTHISI